MLKRLLLRTLGHPWLAPRAVRGTLRLHSMSYRLAGLLARGLEGDGVHPKHRLMDYHRWFAAHLDPGWSVLEVGCGDGALASDLLPHCAEYVAVEIDPANAALARERLKGAVVVHADATAHDFGRRFDVVVLSNVLEHIEDRPAFLRQLRVHAERFLIRVPMVDRDWITLLKRELGVDHRLDATHFVEYTEASFAAELRGAGLRSVEQRVRYGEIYAVVAPAGAGGSALGTAAE